MRIRSVRIRNFRALKDVTIDFDNVTTLIGPNGAGKSTVLRALDWFFNGRVGVLTDQDCSFGSTTEDIEVQVTFDSLSERDRGELGKYVPAGANAFTAWKKRTPGGREVLSANAKGLPAFDQIKQAANATEKKARYASLRQERPELALPAANTAAAIDAAVTAWESENIGLLEDVAEELQTNFFGFNSGGKMSGLFDYVLVAADLRASEESIDAKSSVIGRILERSVDRAAADEAIAALVEETRHRQKEIFGAKFQSQLQAMAANLDAAVERYSPGRKIVVEPSDFDIRPPRTTFDVAVIDGATKTPVDYQGHGFQRTLLVSALQVLAESGAASDEGVICLAIEEPELFQHPTQAQTFAKVLRALAEDASKRIQVVYATHSPYFVEPRHFDQVRRLTRDSASGATNVHSSSLEQVKSRLSGIIDEPKVERQLDGIVANQLSGALFAHRALVVEGGTEAAVFQGIGDRSAPGAIEAEGIAVVPTNGKGSIPLAHAILTTLGIPAYVLFDADGGFEARALANGKDAAKVEEERTAHVRLNRSLMRYLGLVEVDFPPTQVDKEVAILEDHLEGFLESTWPEWVEAGRKYQSDAGVVLSKNQSAYRVVTMSAEGKVPQLLMDILERLRSLP